MWQWRKSSRDIWQSYSDIENAIIEDAYHQNDKQVELDNNITIDLKKNIQFDSNKKKDNKSMEIRRHNNEEASSSSFITDRKRRSERFCLPPKMISKS
ncbi:unnamed protein product [Adineta steineri]|uniref:WWE domain-containing protein n=1 Tax=Adineta steineri TaxID=433720 RepID=A0A815JWK6_9BILA|nr:unnamed protein product [Adineta steineri]CAF1471878.1 unnamed protein product [Adineta steineri]